MPTTRGAFVRDLLRSPVPYFALLSFFLAWAHEPWRDETEAWLLARDYDGFGAFFQAMRYEGTPALWHLLLMPFAKAGLSYDWAQGVHACLAIAGVALIWYRAPFERWEKWLVAFGYYVAYEYDAIARSYALLALLLFMAAWLDRVRLARPILYASCLFLLANTTLHGLIVASVLAAGHGLDVLRSRAWTRQVTYGACIVVAGQGLAVLQMLPPPDLAPWLSSWYYTPSTIKAWALPHSLATAFVPTWSGWLSNGAPLRVALAVVVFGASCWTLWRCRPVLWVYLGVTAALQVLFVFKYYGGTHHAGILFLLYLHCLWVARQRVPDVAQAHAPHAKVARSRAQKALAAFLPVVLVLQVAAAGIAVYRDGTGKFSAAQDVDRYLEENGMLDGKTFVAVFHSYSAHSLLAQLDDTEYRFFFPEFNGTRSNTPWSSAWQARTSMSLDEILQSIDAHRGAAPRVVLVANHPDGVVKPIHGTPAAFARLTLLESFGGLMGPPSEGFDIYEVAIP